MTTRTTNNNKEKADALFSGTSAPAKAGNPFLQPAWAKPLDTSVSLPSPPGVDSRLTKKQKLIYQEGQAQLLQQHFQRGKAIYAVAASAQVEDLANSCYVRIGTNMALRRRASPYPELEPYFNLMMDAQLLRAGQEFNQIASDHARTQNQIASEVIDIDDEDLLPFWAKILRPVNKGR